MSTTIKAHCPMCGEVDLTPQDVALHVDVEPGPESYYAFSCPPCGLRIHKRADERIVRMLESAGVVRYVDETAAPQAEVPRLTYDDLLDLHALLQTDDWFDELLVLVEQG